ncbi:uncharacterized protein C8A04DRAFT_13750 [Dichotomopilus funicola]|uniref:Acetylserotonin methytransferase-like protein n=1 Tax=Dichotomopilus funicola TaxID=1934379 RepID=A0AAN6ZLN4_9PEZI|nr:hypothetical protein C8A04DRAFT_13750 [Dichotomopilus funicola]
MASPPSGGFSLFPNPNAAPRAQSRSQSRPRAGTPQEGRTRSSTEATPPRTGRRNSSAREGRQRNPSNNPWQHALDGAPRQPAAAVEYVAGPPTVPAAAVVAPAAVEPTVETCYSQPVTDAPQRCETAFSEAQTLVRSSSQRSRSSIAKPPIAYTTMGPSSTSASASASASASQSRQPAGEQTAIRSIFPQYNPEVPLAQQDYYPTQASPTHIPQSVISRPLYSPRSAAAAAAETASSSNAPGGGSRAGGAQQPANSGAVRWPPAMGQRNHQELLEPPAVNTTEELRGLWKVTNGWKATSFDSRNYCLKMTTSPDLPPSYTLSSSTGQPFYCLRVDPTSSSALVTLSRYDPNRPFKPAPNTSSSSAANASGAGGALSVSPNSGTSSPSPRASSSLSRYSNYPAVITTAAYTPSTTAPKYQKNWQEVLSTHLSPILPTSSSPPNPSNNDNTTTDPNPQDDPNNGLIAQLWPAAAARLVADRANDLTTVALAQAESARLVWDADSANYFLCHPALAVPFCVAIDRHPALSRTEYALEHLESPTLLARLVRDGTGQGWVEVDTGVAGKVEAVYLVDAAVAALVMVAHLDGKKHGSAGGGGGGISLGGGGAEMFDPPPGGSIYSVGGAGGNGDGRSKSQSSWRGISRASRRGEEEKKKKQKKQSKKDKKNGRKMEPFELDLESQDSDLGKDSEKDKVPGVLRALVKLITVTFKCFVWCATIVFKALIGILSVLTKCCGLGKL